MKRVLFLLLIVLFTSLSVHGQMIVADAVLSEFLELTGVEQLLYWAGIAEQWKAEIDHFAFMVEKTGKQIDMAMQNLASLKDIKNLEGFKDWYNRQLYLEVMAVDAFKGMDVTIGKKSYSMWDIDAIADGLNDTYVQYWNKEFTEEQRREMWIGMGLSPANYAYVQPYRQKAREISREMFAMSEIQNRKNMAYSYEIQRYIDSIKADAQKKPEDQMGTKSYLQILMSSLFRLENSLMDANHMKSLELEYLGVKDALERDLDQTPELTKFPDNAWDLGNK